MNTVVAPKIEALTWSPDQLLAVFGLRGTLRYHFNIPMATPSNNQVKEMPFKAYMALRTRLAWEVLRAIGNRKPAKPIDQAFLVVRRYGVGSLDWSNCTGGLKPLEDVLVLPRMARDPRMATKRKGGESNPNGLGLIYDDDRAHMPIHPWVEQLPAKRGEAFTEVMIYELAPLVASDTGSEVEQAVA